MIAQALMNQGDILAELNGCGLERLVQDPSMILRPNQAWEGV